MTTLTFSEAAMPAAPNLRFGAKRLMERLSFFFAYHYVALAVCSQVHDKAGEPIHYRVEVFYYRNRRRLYVSRLWHVIDLILGDAEKRRAVVTDLILDLLGTVYVDESYIHLGSRMRQGREVVHLAVIMADHSTREQLDELRITHLQPLPLSFSAEPPAAVVEPYLRRALAT